jgi:putative intracellular protease/amidase
MGGLSVLPSLTLAEVDTDDVAVLILPGGERWEREPMDEHLTVLIRQLERRATPIAAICAATTALVRAKVLEGRRHTSNGLSYLQAQVADYDAVGSYVDAPAVRDRGVITASGLGDVEFAREILAELRVLGEADLEAWTTIFRSGRLPTEAALRTEVNL